MRWSDSPFILCKAYSALGSVYHAQGKSADALEMLNHSLKIAKDKGYRGDEASAGELHTVAMRCNRNICVS